MYVILIYKVVMKWTGCIDSRHHARGESVSGGLQKSQINS